MTEQDAPEGAPGNERILRDMQRWKERIEVSLDNRQVFLLFFGCAVVACLVFVLGVMVGKRLEARARDQLPPLRSDPLAVLSETGEEAESGPPRPRDPLKALLPGGKSVPAPNAAPPLPPKIAKAESIKAVPKDVIPPGPVAPPVAPPLAPPMAPREKAAAIEKPIEKPAEPKTAEPKLSEAKTAEPKAAESKMAEPKAAEPKATEPKAADESKPDKRRFTLQVSAFQERAEAEDFIKKLGIPAQKLSIVAAEIPGRGTWYRVRFGEFTSEKAALDAKNEFERSHHMIAYVTRL